MDVQRDKSLDADRNLDEPWKRYAKRKKPVTKDYT